MIDATLAASLLTGGAVLLPGIPKLLSGSSRKIDTQEMLCRTGTKMLTPEERSLLQSKITQAGLSVSAEYFTGIKIVLAGLCMVLTVPLLLISINYLMLLFLAAALYKAPDMWLDGKRKARQTAIKRALPDFTLLLSTTLTAGVNLLMALTESANAVKGPLGDEINIAIKDHLSGKNLTDALHDTAQRIGVDELGNLIRTLSQAEINGAPLAETMEEYSSQMRLTRKFEMMDRAGSLENKMLFPIFLLIFLPMFIIFGYPIMCSFKNF